MIGRKREIQVMEHWLMSERPEFVVVYGRRRVGKTHLIEGFFRNRFAFRATGVSSAPRKTQLRVFHEKLVEYGDRHSSPPPDWFEAFSRLKSLLMQDDVTREPMTGRLVVFIDEMPWFDTPRSDFKQALEYFWNDWGHTQNDLLLVACGSVTSWLTKNLLASTEGFYGRVTGSIGLQPLTLGECEELLVSNGVELARTQIIELYLTFGGIPYYLNMVRRGASPAQVVQALCFEKGSPLEHELELLFRSLFKGADAHLAVARALEGKKGGLTNADLRASKEGISDGGAVTRTLSELELAGFVAPFAGFGGGSYGRKYRIVDPFLDFALRFLDRDRPDSWVVHAGSPAYVAWRGNAFELACLAHISQIKSALGISGVETTCAPWRRSSEGRGAQIDLVIDRRDGIVDLCEMKFTDAPFVLGSDELERMVRRREAFRDETGTSKALHLVLVCAAGVAASKHLSSVQAVVTGDDLFARAVS